jgi:phosphoglycolate phosphatase
LALLPYVDQVFVTEQSCPKQEMLAAVPKLSPTDWIVGDTGKDIKAGKDLGIRTCAVLSGFLNEEMLRAYMPDRVIPGVVDFFPGQLD